jgi:hypothetical protein
LTVQQKIITMTQLALYDKHEGVADQKANDYFRHDYIYRKNLGTRLAVGFGGFLMLGLYWARDILIGGADLFEIDFTTYMNDSIFFILAILAVYSLIGTIQGTREYYLVQKRITRYHALVRQLERINERAKKTAEEKEAEAAEAEFAATKPARPTVPRRITVDEAERNPTRRFEPLDETKPVTRLMVTPDTAPLVYRNPFPPVKPQPQPQRSADKSDGTNSDNTGTDSQDL